MRRLKFDRVVTITLCAALVSLLVGVVVLAQVRRQLVRISTEDYKRQQMLIADQIIETLSNNFINVQNQLRLMATMNRVRDAVNVEACNERLVELLSINQKQLGNLGRVDENGIFMCSINPALIGQDVSQYGTYVDDLIADPLHRPVLSRLSRPPGTNEHVVALHVPVYDSDGFRGTLGGAMYFSRFQDGYLQNVKFGNRGHVVLMDDNGDILYHPDKHQNGRNLLDPKILGLFEPQETMRAMLADVKAGKSGRIDYTVDGTRKTGLYRAFELPELRRHWAVIVTIPEEDLAQVVSQAGINRIFYLLILLFGLTTALLTFVSLRNILRNRELQRAKDDFIAITSHQLRTPATIVKQNLGIVRGGYVKDKRERDKFIDAAYESNENQLTIIENILSASKLDAGQLELHIERIDLVDITAKLTDTLMLSAKAHHHKLKIIKPPEPLYVRADPTKICMTVENLVSNAIKYTPEGGKITVDLRQEGVFAVIAVSDNGLGIDEDDMPELFQRFHRLRSDGASQVPGTGLGLYMTKKIVEMHKGTVGVDSRPGRGTTFTIRLPLDK